MKNLALNMIFKSYKTKTKTQFSKQAHLIQKLKIRINKMIKVKKNQIKKKKIYRKKVNNYQNMIKK